VTHIQGVSILLKKCSESGISDERKCVIFIDNYWFIALSVGGRKILKWVLGK
jgi:hypothetical protein